MSLIALRKTVHVGAMAAVILACFVVSFRPAAAALPMYSITDLGVISVPLSAELLATDGCAATGIGYVGGINDAGIVVASVPKSNFASTVAIYTDEGRKRYKSGADQSFGLDINNRGIVAGMVYIEPPTSRCQPSWRQAPTVWNAGQPSRLPIPSADTAGVALAVDVEGHVAGYSFDPAAGLTFHPVSWIDGVPTVLPTKTCADGSQSGQALALNDKGQIVGVSCSTGVIWVDDTMIEIGTLGGDTVVPASVNNEGRVVGTAETADGVFVGFTWQDDAIAALPMPSKAKRAGAVDINDTGTIVGTASGRAVAWYGESVVYLDDRLDVPFVGSLTSARGVNASGQIACEGFGPDGSTKHAYLLTPSTALTG